MAATTEATGRVAHAKAEHRRRQLARRAVFERFWVVTVLLYALFRIWLAYRFFGKYGVNIAWFSVVEIGSSLIYAVASARLVGALIDSKRAHVLRFGFFTFAGFAIPDLFVVLTSDRVPKSLYVVFAVAVLCSGAFSFYEVRKKVRKGRSGVAH